MKNYDLKKNKTYLYFCVFFLLLHLLWVRTNWIFRIHFLDCTRMRMSQIPGVLVDRKSLNYPKSHDIKFSFVLLFAKLFHSGEQGIHKSRLGNAVYPRQTAIAEEVLPKDEFSRIHSLISRRRNY